MRKFNKWSLAFVVLPLFSAAEEGFDSEITYGLINTNSIDFFTGEFSEIPTYGATFRYYFTELTGELPSNIESHLSRKSWIQYDFNLPFALSPSIGGQVYFSDTFDLKYDVTYFDGFSGNSDEFIVLSDVSLNVALNKTWQAGVGFSNIYSYDEQYYYNGTAHTEYESDSSSAPAFNIRYTNIEGEQGWDITTRLIKSSGDYFALSANATYLSSKESSYITKVSYIRIGDEHDESLIQFSLSEEFWFSKYTAITYGWGAIGSPSGGVFPLMFEINGKTRF